MLFELKILPLRMAFTESRTDSASKLSGSHRA